MFLLPCQAAIAALMLAQQPSTANAVSTDPAPDIRGAMIQEQGEQGKAKDLPSKMLAELVEKGGISSLDNFSSDLPLILLEIQAGTLTNRERVRVLITVIGLSNGRSSCSGPIDYQGIGELWLRGSSTRKMPKRPYRLECQDQAGEDLEVPMLGMPKESDWILHASYFDKTFVRDALAYELWREMGYYAPRTRYVEVFLHHAGDPLSMDDYEGLYVLTEKIKRDKNRVNIRKLTSMDNAEPAICGGYIFKRDRLNPGEKGFLTSQGIRLAYEEPKESEITEPQREWLKGYINRFESALYGEHFCDPEKGYAQYIDVKSFVDFHWIGEMSRNMDAYWASEFFHKDRNGKIVKGPIWDWDLSFGNVSYLRGYQTNGWRWEQVRPKEYGWYGRLFDDPEFVQLFIDRWDDLRGDIFATSNLLARVDRLADRVSEAQARNFKRWPILGKPTFPNWYVANNYQDEVEYLKKWITDRLAWIDSQGYPPPRLEIRAIEGSDPGKFRISFSSLPGTVFYTTNGTDPRLSGGAVSPSAADYVSPFLVGPGAQVVARLRSDFELWSPPVRQKHPGAQAANQPVHDH